MGKLNVSIQLELDIVIFERYCDLEKSKLNSMM